MRLDPDEATRRLVAADHGILATRHPDRGVDAVPVCFTVIEDVVGVPIDRVKPKTSPRLQRVRNLEADPRAALVCEEWDMHDWSKLWWVRAELVASEVSDEACAGLEASLRDKYEQYRGAVFDAMLTLRIESVGGWSSEPRP